MYLYISIDKTEKPSVATAESRTTILGIGPVFRGRPSKNHEKYQHDDFEFYVGAIADEDEHKVSSTSELKQAIVDGKIETMDVIDLDEFAIPPYTMITKLAEGMYDLLSRLQALLAGVEAKQVSAILPALETSLKVLETRPGDAETISTLAEIFESNKRMLNGFLLGIANGGWFHTGFSSSTPVTAPSAPAAPRAANKDTKHETPTESIKMATTTANFGFGKLSGEKTATATLKLAEAPETNDASTANGVFMPSADETYIINEQVAQLFKILQISRQNCPQNVRLVGPHGCGKTELAIQFAARLGLPLLIMDCANLREARDWFGYKTAREGTVYWHESQFVQAVAAGNHVILLDELNRANPHLLNTLMPLLDARRFTFLEEKGDKICVGPGTVFFASMNEGAGYTGTSALDRAIRDRFPRAVELTYLGEKDETALLMKRVGVDEDIANRLVQMANKIRQDSTGISASLTESLSTRQLIAAAHDFAIGGVETLTFTIINHFSADGDDDSERVRVQNIIQGKFGDLFAAAAEAKSKKGA
jgi:MoxR-like ATPase